MQNDHPKTPLVSDSFFERRAAETEPPAGSALSDPQTATALDRLRRIAWVWLAVGAAALVVAVAVINIDESRANDLLRTGVHTTGQVIETRDSRYGGSYVVQYMANGGVLNGVIHMTESSSPYRPGQYVDVVYDSHDPARIRTTEEQNESPAATTGIIIAFFFAFAGLAGGGASLRSTGRWRRELGSAHWTPYLATYLPSPSRRTSAGIKLTPIDQPDAEPYLLRVGTTVGLGRSSTLAPEKVVWVAGDPKGKVVLGTPGARDLFAGLPARGSAAKRLAKRANPGSASPRRQMLGRMYLLGIAIFDWIAALAVAGAHNGLLAIFLFVKGSALFFAFVRSRPATDSAR